MSTTTAATPAKRFALIGEIEGEAVATGFWRSDDAADAALVAANELAEQAGIVANLRLITVDNAVLGNPKATASDLLTRLAPTPMKAHTRKAAAKANKATAAKAADSPRSRRGQR